jgi:hypothetical protein
MSDGEDFDQAGGESAGNSGDEDVDNQVNGGYDSIDEDSDEKEESMSDPDENSENGVRPNLTLYNRFKFLQLCVLRKIRRFSIGFFWIFLLPISIVFCFLHLLICFVFSRLFLDYC